MVPDNQIRLDAQAEHAMTLRVTNPSQERHINRIGQEFADMMSDKYRRGVEKHGGDVRDLTVLTLVNHALDEAIDQVVYLLTLRAKLMVDEEYPIIGRQTLSDNDPNSSP